MMKISLQHLKTTCLFLLPSILLIACQSKTVQPLESQRSTAMVVEASCGQCNFDLSGGGCDLAIRTDGKIYFVDGITMDELGDAHAADGLCTVIHSAKVTGQVKDGRFLAKSFALLVKK